MARAQGAVRVALLALGAVVALIGVLVIAAMLAVQSGWAEQRVERLLSERTGRGVESERMRLLAGWPPQLETTYTAKTFAALLHASPGIGSRSVLFWHTHASSEPEVPEIEENYPRQAKQ